MAARYRLVAEIQFSRQQPFDFEVEPPTAGQYGGWRKGLRLKAVACIKHLD